MTLRAFLIGLTLSIFAAIWPAWSSYIIDSSRADHAHLSAAILIPFLVLLLINAPLSKKGRGLTGSELILIVMMGMVASLAQGEWIAGYFLGIITAVSYFASPENGWEDTLLTRIPEWAVVGDRAVTSAFYQGLPTGDPFRWEAWLIPLLWWGAFFLAFFLANLCIVTVFRRQWMDHERLPFPVAAGLLELTGEGDVRGTLTTLMRNRLFQTGAIIVFLIFIWDPISWFFQWMPEFRPQLDRPVQIARGFPVLRWSPNPMTIAFAWFTKSEVLLSLWLFHLLTILEAGIVTRFVMEMGAPEAYTSYHPAVGWQSFGSLIVFVGWGIWVARDHLTAVGRKAFVGDNAVDDTEELMSYRTAVFCFLGCGLFCGVFFWRLGMTAATLVAFWGACLVLYIGFARIIVETGLIFLRTPLTAQGFVWQLFGGSAIGPVGATALGLSYTFFCDGKTTGVTTLAHIPRLGLAVERAGRSLVPAAVGVAYAAGLVGVLSYILYHGNYGVGSYNFGSVSFNGSTDGAVGLWGGIAGRIRSGDPAVGWSRLLFLGIGATVTAGIYAIRYRFPGLALHPIGLAICGASPLRSSACNIFFVWIVKGLVFRFGGLDRYHKLTPFFMGIFIGYLAAIAAATAVDAIWFPGQGHKIHDW